MKSFRLPHFIEPAYLYLSGFFLFVGLLIVVGNSFVHAPATAHHPHRVFPAESEVKSLVPDGESMDDVMSDFGEPESKGGLEDNVTVLNYLKPMNQVPPDDKTYYSGFAVYVKNGKVFDVIIIRGSDLRN